MNNKAFGYVRVSTTEQNTGRQLEAIRDYCNTNNISIDIERDIFQDKQSGKDMNRPQYKALKQCLRSGDTLIIKEIDRLGRNMEQIKEEWQEITKAGINIVVIDTPILNTTNKTDLEKTLISNIVFELLAYMAEKERQKIRQRQAEGIVVAKAKGKHLGRPKAEYPCNWDSVYKEWKDGDIKAIEAMKIMNLKKNTFYNLVKQYEKV